jgi:hypothetical protein
VAIASIALAMVAGSGQLPKINGTFATGNFAPCASVSTRRPRITMNRAGSNRGNDACPSDDSRSVRRRGSGGLTVETKAKLPVDLGDSFPIKRTDKHRMIPEPLLPIGIGFGRVGPYRRPQVVPKFGVTLADRSTDGDHHQLRQTLDGRCPPARLPLDPLFTEPTPRPFVHGEIRQRQQPRLGLAGCRVETITVADRLHQQQAEPFGLGLRAERLRPLPTVDRPAVSRMP